MSKIVLVLAATSVGLGLTSLHLVKQLRDSKATIDQLQSQVASLQTPPPPEPALSPFTTFGVPHSEMLEPSEEPASAQDKPARSNDVVKVAGNQPATALAAPARQPSREEAMRMVRDARERHRQLMQDPEYREAMRVQARSNLARQYPGVIQELNIDQQQAEEFYALLSDQQMRMSERMEPLWDSGSAETLDSATLQERHRKVQQVHADIQRENEEEFIARFGQQKFQAWKEYQSTVGQRYQLEHMRSTLATQGIPLSEDVSKPMLKALAAAQKAEMEEYSAGIRRPGGVALFTARAGSSPAFEGINMEQQIETTKRRNQRTLDAISPYLTYEQRQAIEREQQAQLKMQEAQLRIMRARNNGISNNGISNNGISNYQFSGESNAILVQP